MWFPNHTQYVSVRLFLGFTINTSSFIDLQIETRYNFVTEREFDKSGMSGFATGIEAESVLKSGNLFVPILRKPLVCIHHSTRPTNYNFVTEEDNKRTLLQR